MRFQNMQDTLAFKPKLYKEIILIHKSIDGLVQKVLTKLLKKNEVEIIDYYNDYPQIINVIDKMNQEVILLKKENDKLKSEILEICNKYNKELKEYKTSNELKQLLLIIAYEEKIKKKNRKKKFMCF